MVFNLSSVNFAGVVFFIGGIEVFMGGSRTIRVVFFGAKKEFFFGVTNENLFYYTDMFSCFLSFVDYCI